MDPTLVLVEGFKIAGITTRTTNDAEADPGRAKIPGLWGRFFTERVGELVEYQVAGSEAYGVYWGYDSDASGAYNLTTGVPVVETYQAAQELTVLRIAPGLFMAFHAAGAPDEVVPAIWRQVWEYFTRPASYKRSYTTDFERYEGPAGITIFVAVESDRG